MGFVFGRCHRCGWNYLSKKWERIKVDVSDLLIEIRYALVKKHEEYWADVKGD